MPNRDTDPGHAARSYLMGKPVHGSLQSLLQLNHNVGGCMVEHSHKFVASISYQRISQAQAPPDDLGRPAQDVITDMVAVSIIDLLEPVEVHHHQNQRRVLALGPAAFLLVKAV